MSQENVLLNQSTPPFAPGAPMAADSDSDMTRLTTGDVNNDGHPDIAAAHGYRRAGLYLSNGDRSFAGEQLLSETWWDVAENTGATSIAVEDLDRDGNLDLVIPIYGDHYREHMVQLYRGLGDGTFELWPVDGYNATRDFEGVDQDGVDDGVIVARGAANPMFPLVADFNGDGRPDVVVSGNNGAWSVDVLTQSADQQFSVADSDRAGQNPQYLAAGDFNEDGYPDVVAGVLYTGVLVFLNAADGSGTLHQEGGTYLSDHHHYVVAADFDGDGHLDIAARGNRDRKVFILYGDGTGRFPSTASFSTSGTDGYLAAADIDQDGDSDLVVASKSTKSVDLLLNDGTGQFDAPVSTVLDAAPWGIAADDFDQDGLVDVAVARGDDSVQVLWNRSDTPRVTDGSFSIAENSPDATLLGTVVATDPNVGDTLTYAITAGNGDPDGDGKAAFAIAPATGKITVSDAGDLDFETTATFSLTVTATDADGHVGSGAIAVNLVNVDEPGNEPPVAQDASFTLPENSSNGTEVGAVIATDIDVGDTLSYALTAGNSDPNGDGNPAFVIDPTTGVITVNDSGDLDFETTLSFNLTVKATDAGGLSDTAAVRVDLVNVNELDNNVDQLIFSEAIGNTIDHISPTGDDFEPLVSGLSAPHAIAIDPEAGKLYFTQWSSTEVRRADLDGTHVEDLYPSAGGGGQGIAIDPTRNLVFWGEYYKGLYRGSMDGTQPATLLVSSATLRSAAGAAGLNGVGMGLDVDPAARVVYFFTRDNSSAAGRDIWRVNYDGTGLQKLADLQSTDSMEVDLENRYLYYSDIAGGQEGMYRMGLDNGVKEHLFDLPATCGSIAIDNASNTIFFLTSPGEPTNLGTLWRSNLDGSDRILLKDNLPGGGGVEFLRGAIYITPDDFTVIENSPTDTHVGTVSVQGGSAPLIFAITVGNSDPDGDGQSAFTLDATTGVITVNDAGDLDFETTPGFKLTVTATDPQGHSGRGTITVKLANVDEPGNEPPVAQDATFTLPENSANGTAVGTVIVTDIDAGDTLTYAITAGNSDPNGDSKPAFVINPTTGVITVNDSGDLDFETTPSFDLTVTATDSGGLSDTATIKIDLADIFEREGTAGGDHLGGTAGDDVLSGLAGDDTLTGLAGDDVLDGGDGADRVREQGDVDFTLTDGQLTGLGTDTLVGIERASLNGGVGNNRLDAFGFNRGPVILDGGAGDDLLIGPSLAGGMHRWGLGYNLFIGGEGNDTLTGGVGIDCIKETGDVDFALTGGQLTGRGTDHFSSMELACLVGGAGDNRLDASGFTGSLTMLDGGAGDDTLLGGAALDTLRARGNVDFTLTDTQLSGLGTDTLVTMDSAHLIGGAGDDTLDVSGFSGDRSCLEGGAGDDTLIGRTGGMDRVREHGDVDFTLTDTQLTGRGTDTLVDIERATLIGGAGNNRLDASGFTGRLAVLAGGDRDDTLVGRTGGIDRVGARGNADFTLTDTQLIGQGTDTLVDIDQAMLIGDGDDNTLDASAFTRGRVFLRGESGNDSLTGGTGDDYLSGGVGDDTLVGGAGTDCVEGWGDTDFTLTATQLIGLGTDSLDGIEQAYLCGGPGDNVLDASAFTGSLVTFEGQSGDDTLRGRAGGVDTVRARGDVDFTLTDTQLTGLGTDTLTSIEQAQLLGHSGDNIFDASGFTRGPVNLSGGGGDDTVLGGSGDDSLSGGHGADILVGGLGQDRLAGGLGADTFKFASVAESGITSALRDVITDFDPSQGDKLDLSAIDADTAVAEDQAFASLTEGDAFSGVFANPGELYFDQLGHILYGNHDADGAADFSIQITGVSSLVGTVVL